LGSMDLPVAGFSGADNHTLMCTPVSLELGLVGSVRQVNSEWIESLLDAGVIPAIAPIGVGAGGEAYNINADWAASYLASALGVSQAIFLTDQPGILDTAGLLIPSLKSSELQSLVDREVVKGGMMTKTLSILYALNEGVKSVRVMNGKDALRGRADHTIGTWCVGNNMDTTTKKEVLHYAAV
jgi:acetylglutamate kinase